MMVLSDLHLATILSWIALAILGIAALWDLASRKIPNSLPLLLAVCGIAIQISSGAQTIWISLAATLFIFLMFLWAYHKKWVGGGDAKLLPALIPVVPASQIFPLLLYIALMGALLAALIIMGRMIRFSGLHNFEIMQSPQNPWHLDDQLKCDLPYALAIFLGSCIIWQEALEIFSTV